MAREINMDSQRQEFWKEAILKENLIRLNWQKDFWTKNPRVKAKRTPAKEKRLKLPRIDAPAKKETNVKKESKIENLVEAETKKTTEEVLETGAMRPVSRATREVLYQGISKEETGRYKYLHLRKQQKPEEKYVYPVTSNWQYGWQLGDMTKYGAPVYGLTAIMRDSFFRKNGIFPETSNIVG
ncbi:protein SPMIP1 [Lepisosteus oculatus]|uniref:Sperm microtubule inner protein 1 n=1 Tax=Lepisosteus oculatus TaxID=7918 RepID=W5NEW2_LEPOC|nr:PREDICTED: uncharacterized protein LOC102695468 [Lepisosteus oculatus]